MSLVLDGSAALAWCFDDETTPQIDALMLQVGARGAVVPAIWRLEVANALHAGIRRGRMTSFKRDELLTALSEMDIRTDPETDRYAWSTTVRLAERFALTIYDASYLELAQCLSLPLASLSVEAALSIGSSPVAKISVGAPRILDFINTWSWKTDLEVSMPMRAGSFIDLSSHGAAD